MADSWIETRSGGQFFFDEPTADMIDIKDIASALSKQCRYNGHTNRFYSVAEHSIHVAGWLRDQECSVSTVMQGLLHDATEAYIGDMVSPLKALMPAFQKYEDELWIIIATKYGVPVEMNKAVKEADARILVDEKAVFMDNTRHAWGIDSLKSLGLQDTMHRLHNSSMRDMELLFLNVFQQVSAELHD